MIRWREDINDGDPKVHTSKRTVPLDFSDTGDFGITKEELKFIIRRELAKKSRAQKQRALFGSVLHSMKMHPRGDKREAMLKVFVEICREMKNARQVSFKSGKTALLIQLA